MYQSIRSDGTQSPGPADACDIFRSSGDDRVSWGSRWWQHRLFGVELLGENSEWAMNANHDVDYSITATLEEKLHFRGDLDDVEIDVLQRPWFRRVWVFQEVVVSRNVTIQCGSRKISWNDFCRVILLNPRYHDRYGFSIMRGGKIDVVRDMFHARCSYQEAHGMGYLRPPWHAEVEDHKGGDSSVLNTLSRARQQEAFDPRDKIYALLGVSTGVDLSGELIAVNYRKRCSQVYLDFARHIMGTTQSYDLLSYLDDYSVGRPTDLGASRFSVKKAQEVEPQDYVFMENGSPLEKATKEYLPSWVPNWDRSAWNHPSPWKFRHTGRTVLSTLEPESEMQTRVRKDLVSRSRIWSSTRTLAAIGVIIGEVIERGPSIALLGNDELRFQDIRDRHRDDQSTLAREVMGLWQTILNQGELTLGFGNMLERWDPVHLPNVSQLLSYELNPPRDSVEHHLLGRGRKSVTWNNDNNKAVAVIRDKSSIVETKRVAAYRRFNEEQEVDWEGLALILSRAATNPEQSKDLIVYLRGARVPFFVRQEAHSFNLVDKRKVRKELNSIFELENCTIVGECLVNGFGDIAKECEAALEEAEAVEESSEGELPVWTPFSTARIFLIS
ncbi:hypothetical protein DL98DRAFT_520116 [Cadophora sp. DSE1049]|nr:hypothetical protein DL98DRAFT_520116 [Cadophora sp. DSE1049]